MTHILELIFNTNSLAISYSLTGTYSEVTKYQILIYVNCIICKINTDGGPNSEPKYKQKCWAIGGETGNMLKKQGVPSLKITISQDYHAVPPSLCSQKYFEFQVVDD